MKKCFSFLVSLLFAFNALAQQADSVLHTPDAVLLKKSQRQQTLATVALLTGLGLLITAAVIPQGDLIADYSNSWIVFGDGKRYKNDDLKAGLALGGGALVLSSIPLYISASKNKRMAMALMGLIRVEQASALASRTIFRQSFPALGVRLGL